MSNKSQFEFFNIIVSANGQVEYLWMCTFCGNVTPNILEDKPPGYCNNCDCD